ncbi:Actin cytoskeleton-regulatory complex protein SLA1 [Hypsizygus marmoreus]|uniref:Actin cytoskeleton-regulatory complex protein SLA1 n=1 Tax=Hypsizygus marmoreus TaxID=39966 RepID=A0A369JVN2_HYPMA|nr:Actin cytoskeleton-regulatory complex protein SLA1 [Hypsizygus marmoreus]
MSPEPEVFLAVLKASYDYDPQSDDEIAIKEDQLIFLKEKVDDDWWKVKVKGDTQDDDTPVGLVPAAYVEQAEHTSTVKVLYDYEAAASGELSVQEDEILLVFEREQDWLLVQSQKEGGGAGFVPGNYVEAYTEEETPPAPVSPQIVVPPPAPRPVSTYVDPADRVASARVTADGIKTWSVSEIDKKGKKKKGTLGIGNGAVFFASESDKTPVQKWQTADVQNTSSEKAKHVSIDIGGATPINLHFHAGSKDNVDEIIEKLNSSKALSAPPHSPGPSDTSPTPDSPPPREMKKASVHFSNSSPVIIPSAQDEQEEEEEEEEAPQVKGPSVNGRQPSRGGDNDAETGLALYDFSADGEDELSITAGERLTILERDSDEWWKCRNSKGTEGVVPAQYIEASASLAPAAQSSRAAQISHEEEEEEDTAAAEEEARRAAEEARLAREQEKQRAEEARKKLEAQKRAKEAAVAAEAERKRRKEASAARVSSPPASEPKRKSAENGSASTSGRPSTEANRPPPERTRVWHDRSGQFRVEAAFLGFNNGKLRLHKVNGVIVEVPSEKMSVEDMQYVERLTSKKSRPPPTKQMSDDDIPLGLSHPSSGSVPNSARAAPPKKVSKIDWFDFFLSAGCDLDDCTRYSASFERDKMDETLLPDITDATMRSLGVREGDIIRITKAIEKRKPNDNLVKPSPYAEEQVRRDEELARQLQAQETGGTRSPAPNLFAGPGGVLKNPRRGRPQPSKSLPLSSVDIKAISTVSDQVLRTSSPQILTPTSAPSSSAPVAAPPRSSSAVPVASGFDDDAWTNRPSSTKPLVGTPPAPRAPSAPPAAAAPAPVSAPSAPISQPAPTATTSASSAQPTSTMPLARTTESDIFDQLSRLSELRKQSTPMQPPPSTSPSITVPPSYPAGLGMRSSPAPISQLLQNPQLNVPQQQLQPYNGPRGPFAPVPSNQGLLQPLIPTHTGFSNFIPTRPGPAVSPFQNPVSQPSFLTQQPSGMPSMQPMMSQPTGMPFNGYNPMQNTGAFPPVQSQFTGFNPNFGQSPFNSASSPPPPIPPLPSNTNNTSPANIFAQMKSGTFATDNNSNPQPSVLTAQATGWGQPYQGGYTGYQH